MFVWDTRAVNRALFVEIPEVISIFNRAYLNAWTHGVALRGSRRDDLVPEFNPRAAFAVAYTQTIATLNAMESVSAHYFDCDCHDFAGESYEESRAYNNLLASIA